MSEDTDIRFDELLARIGDMDFKNQVTLGEIFAALDSLHKKIEELKEKK